MWIRRRINGTLNQIEATTGRVEAHAHDLMEDYEDGFGVRLKPENGFGEFIVRGTKMFANYLVGVMLARLPMFGAHKEPTLDYAWLLDYKNGLPFTLVVDPTVDVLKADEVLLEGGEWDGWKMKTKNKGNATLLIKSKDGDMTLKYARQTDDLYRYVAG